MSSLITKATKRRSGASPRIRTTKGQKAAARKPKRPGKITAAPKAKRSTAKRAASASKPKARATKRVSSRSTVKSPVAKKKTAKAAASVGRKRMPTSRPKQPKRAIKAASAKRSLSKASVRKALLARRRVLPPRPLPAPPKKPPSPSTLAAVRAFEQALRLFNRHEFVAAKSAFESLLSKFAEQAEIVARVRTYLAICEHRLARTPSLPRNPDSLYNQGIFELNKGNTSEAIELFEKGLKAEPRADHIYYSLAAAYARLDDIPKALDALRRSIGIRPAHRSHARRDLDFAGLRTNEDFQQLTGFGFDLVDE